MRKNIVASILESGYTTVSAIILATIVGFFFPEIGKSLKPLSKIFLTLLSLAILPIIFASITSSVIHLCSQKSDVLKITRVLGVFAMALIICSSVGMFSGMLFNNVDEVMKSEYISNMIFKDVQKSIMTVTLDDTLNSVKTFKMSDFFVSLLPSNPFESFAKGNVLQILMLSIFLGFSISTLGDSSRKSVNDALSIVMISFKKILQIPTKILPIGMFFLLSSSFSEVDINVLVSMKSFITGIVICFFMIVVIALILLWIYSPLRLLDSIKMLRQAIIVAFSTSSNQASLPFLSATLIDNFKLPERVVNLSLPLGITACRVSSAAYFSFVSIFIAQIYSMPLTLSQYAFIIIAAIITSLASSGASTVNSIAMISIVLNPLGLPLGSLLVVLIIIDQIIDPIRTTSSLIMNAALSCAVIKRKKTKKGSNMENENAHTSV